MQVKKESHVAGKTGAQRSDTKGKGRYDCIWLGFPHMLFRLARLFEQGIESGYAPGNWKKGTDLRRWLEGGCRHLSQFAEGLTNEDHLMASIWNLLCLGETRHLIETGVLPAELDNLPLGPCPSCGRGPVVSDVHPEIGPCAHCPVCGWNDLDAPEEPTVLMVDLKPGDRRINPETGLLETYMRVVDIASPEGDESVIVYYDTTQTNHAPVCRCIKCLKEDVDSGGLLSDRENDRLEAADCGRSHPFTAHSMAGSIPCLYDACINATKIKPSDVAPFIAEAIIENRKPVDVEPPTFYVCGPMTGMRDFNFPLFDQVTELARSQGLSVISPAELDREHGIDPSVDPDSVERARRADPNLIQTIVQRDTQVIVGLERDKGDGLILLPGWEESTGARAEIALALWMGLSFKRVRTTWHGQACDPEIEYATTEWVKLHLFYRSLED